MKHAYIFKHLLKEQIGCFYDPHVDFRNECHFQVPGVVLYDTPKRDETIDRDKIDVFNNF